MGRRQLMVFQWAWLGALFACMAVGGGDAGLPAAAADAIGKAYPEARIKEVDRERERGAVFYEVELLVEGKEIEATVDRNGVIGSVEQELPAAAMPAAVAQACAKACPNAKVREVERREIRGVWLFTGFSQLKEPVVVYNVELELAEGGQAEITLGLSGELLRKSIGTDDDDDDDDD